MKVITKDDKKIDQEYGGDLIYECETRYRHRRLMKWARRDGFVEGMYWGAVIGLAISYFIISL